ncbi:hypothetical protein [Roseomonas sp. KE0001]|nr:hypothetical protein [Roseomonas sp. KE0001]
MNGTDRRACGHAGASGRVAMPHRFPDPRALSVGRDMPEGAPL